jgi:hypothetical protein
MRRSTSPWVWEGGRSREGGKGTQGKWVKSVEGEEVEEVGEGGEEVGEGREQVGKGEEEVGEGGEEVGKGKGSVEYGGRETKDSIFACM